jgi:aspartate aminotransferase
MRKFKSNAAGFNAFTKRLLWNEIPLASADKILGLNVAYKEDNHPNKINLGVGAYKDDFGKSLVLPSVREAECRILARNMDHEYAGIDGVPTFVSKALEFSYGTACVALKEGRIAAVQALSGTGALRVAGDLFAKFFGRGTVIYLPHPTVSFSCYIIL